MTVEIRGTSTANKGAQLMLEAIVDRLGDKVDLSANPALLDYRVRARLGMFQTLHINRFPGLSGIFGSVLPSELRARYGLIADRDITGVLDASGFAYSDSFSPKRSEREAIYGKAWRRRGVPKVMLPQAFGPFDNAEVSRWARKVLNQADIVFVRDAVSRHHLNRLQLSVQVERSPDFTIGLAPLKIPAPVVGEYAALVPNTKLVAKSVVSHSDYLSFLVRMGDAAATHGLKPVVVVHESTDRQLANSVANHLNAPIFDDPRPRALKAVIGGSSLLIASRFHAIVSGLSLGVRTIAIGWSHKYGELMQDFDVPEWIRGLDADPVLTVRRILADEGGVTRLRDAKTVLVGRVASMWETTEQILNVEPGRNLSHAPLK